MEDSPRGLWFILALLVCLTADARAQALRTWTLADYVVRLDGITNPGSSVDGHFQITRRADGLSQAIVLSGVVNPEHLEELRVGQSPGGRIFLAALNYRLDRYFIIDPVAGQIIDEVDGFRSALSPDSRFIAFRRPYGAASEKISAVYLIYDLHLSPAANRMRYQIGDRLNPDDGGWAVFPPENQALQSVDVLVDDASLYHEPHSDLYWLAADTLFFADYSASIPSVVRVKAGAKAHAFQITTVALNPDSVLRRTDLNGHPLGAFLHVERIEYVAPVSSDSVRLVFDDNGRLIVKSLVVSFPPE